MLADTGSSWTWVYTCGDNFLGYSSKPDEDGTCPYYYFDSKKSSSNTCTDKTKYIKYGKGSASGKICHDVIKVSNTADMQVKMPFVENKVMFDFGRQQWDGILGLAPVDESAGPLLVPNLYGVDKLAFDVFAFLPSVNPDKLPKITYGNYQREGDEPQFYYSDINEPIAHRVSGSFHWEV